MSEPNKQERVPKHEHVSGGGLSDTAIRRPVFTAMMMLGERIGADRAAMLEVFEDREAALDDRVLRTVLEVDDEADAARIMDAVGVEQAKRLGLIGFANDQVRGGRLSVPCLSHLQCPSFEVVVSGEPVLGSFRHALCPGRTWYGSDRRAQSYSWGAALHPNGRSFGLDKAPPLRFRIRARSSRNGV